MKLPYSYYGGKRKIAKECWDIIGDTQFTIEPFFGGGAFLLSRPLNHFFLGRNEIINDIDGLVVNFWRSMKFYPDLMAKELDYPISEIDLAARIKYIYTQEDDFVKKMREQSDYCEPRRAAYWCWALNQWIGGGQGMKEFGGKTNRKQRPILNFIGGVNSEKNLMNYCYELQNRLRYTRIVCGDWKRVLTTGVTKGAKSVGVFLDPPYGDKKRQLLYGCDSYDVASEVREWCKENGSNSQFRIILCGYEGEHNELEDLEWKKVAWNQRNGFCKNGNGKLERYWYKTT
jgi:DNA adenine methylase